MKWVAEYAEMEENAVCKRKPTSSLCPSDFPTQCAATMVDWCSKKSDQYSWLYATTDYAYCRAAWAGHASSTSSAIGQTVALFASGGTFTILRGIFRAGNGLNRGLRALRTASRMARLKFVLGMIRKAAVKAAKNLWKNLKKHLKKFIKDKDNREKAMEFATLAASEAAAEKAANKELAELGTALLEAADPTGIYEHMNYMATFKTCPELQKYKKTGSDFVNNGGLDELAGLVQGACGVGDVFDKSRTEAAGCKKYCRMTGSGDDARCQIDDSEVPSD